MKILTRGVTEATLVGLRPGTEYELRVLSQDLIGDGLFSKPVFTRTLGKQLSSRAVVLLANCAATASTGQSVFTWHFFYYVNYFTNHTYSYKYLTELFAVSQVFVSHYVCC